MATCDVSKIDSNVSGLRFAEEECLGLLPQFTPAVQASATVVVEGLPSNGETLTVGSLVFTFADSASDPEDIQIAANVNDMATAIAASMAISSEVTASVIDDTITLVAATAGVAGNSLTLSSTAVDLGLTAFGGGSDAVGDEPTWKPLEPNSYSDFGGSIQTVVRAPITQGRQRKKGVTVGVDASGGFNMDLTQTNAQDLLSGFLFADIRTKASYQINATDSDLSVVLTPDELPKLVSAGAVDFTALGIIPGEWIFIGGDDPAQQFSAEANNGFKRVREVAAGALTLDKSDFPLESDNGAGKTIRVYLGRVLKNETGALIKRKSYQLERTLGSLDGLDPPQAEYLVGAIPSELALNLATRDKLTADFSFVATDHETRTQQEGLKPGQRPPLVESDAFNTSDHIRRIRLARVSTNQEAPQALFAFATEVSLKINNTLSPSYAIGRAGAIDVTAGTFAVGGNVEVYFSDVEAIRAVRNNEDITLDVVLVRQNAGIVIDLPLISLGGGQATLELDKPIMLPLTTEASTGAKIDSNLDYTLMFTIFDSLPDMAE